MEPLIFNALAERELVSSVNVWDLVNGPRLLALAGVSSSCQQQLVRVVLVLATRLPETTSAGVAEFCRDHTEAVRSVVHEELSMQLPVEWCVAADLVRVCPALFSSRELRLGAVMQTVSRSLRSQAPAVGASLSVSRAHAFSESIEFLNTCDPLTLIHLPPVCFRGESGTDVGGLRREWFSHLATLIFGCNSSDPAGGLFVPREGTEYIELDVSRPFGAEQRDAYYAVGRYLAASVLRNAPIGVPLPRAFFSRLLDVPITLADVQLDDPTLYRGLMAVRVGGEFMVRQVLGLDYDSPCPTVDAYVDEQLSNVIVPEAELRLEVIRAGFESLIPIASINAFLTSDDLRAAVYGTPEVSVDDLMAHTSYDGRTFTASSPQIQWLWAWLRRSDNALRRQFLRFVTGLSQLPMEGMAGLPNLQIQAAIAGDLAPRSHTCGFLLSMPVYRSAEELEEWMSVAVSSDGFGLA